MDPHGQRGAAGAPIAAPSTSAKPSRKRLLADEPAESDAASAGEDCGPHAYVPATATPAAPERPAGRGTARSARRALQRALQHIRNRNLAGREKRQRKGTAAAEPAVASAAAPAAAEPAAAEPAAAVPTRGRFRPADLAMDVWIGRYASSAVHYEASDLVNSGDVFGVWSPSGSNGSTEVAAFVSLQVAAGAHVRVRVSVAADGAVHDSACSCIPDTILFCPHIIAVLLAFAETDVDTRTFRQGDTSPRAVWGLAALADECLFPQPLVDETRVQRRIDGALQSFKTQSKQRRIACNRCDAEALGTLKGCCLECGIGQLSSRKNEAPLSSLLSSIEDMCERATALLDSQEFESCAVLCEAAAHGFLLSPLEEGQSPLDGHGSLSALASALIGLCMLPACDPSVPEQLLGRIASVTDRVAAAVKNSEGRWQAEAHVARTGWGPLLRSILDGSRKGQDGADLREELSAAGETESSLRVRVAGLLERSHYREALRLAKAAGDAAGVRKAYEALGTSQRKLANRALRWPAEKLDPKDARAIAAVCCEDAPAAALWLLLSAVRTVQARLGEALDKSEQYTKSAVQKTWSETQRRDYEDRRRQRYRRAGASFVDYSSEDPREEDLGDYNTDDDEDPNALESNDERPRARMWPYIQPDRKPRSVGRWPRSARPEESRVSPEDVESTLSWPWEARDAWKAELTGAWHPDASVSALEARLRNLLACAVDLALSFMKCSHGDSEGPASDNTLLRLAARAAAARLVAEPAAGAAAAVEHMPDELVSLVTLEACALTVAEAGRGLPGAWRAAIAFREAGQPRLALAVAAGALRPATHPGQALYASEDDGTRGRTFLCNLMRALEDERGPGAQAIAEFKSGRNGATADALFAAATLLKSQGKIDDAIRVCTTALELAETPEQAPYAQTSCSSYTDSHRCVNSDCTMRDWLICDLCPKATVAAVRATLGGPLFSPNRIMCGEGFKAALRLVEHLFDVMLSPVRDGKNPEVAKERRMVRRLLAFCYARILGPNAATRFKSRVGSYQVHVLVELLITDNRSTPPELADEAAAALPFVYLLALHASRKERSVGSPVRSDCVRNILESALQSLSVEQFEREILGEMLLPEAAVTTACALFGHAAQLEPEAQAREAVRRVACAVMQRAVRLFAEAEARDSGAKHSRHDFLATIASDLVPALPVLAECVGPAAAVEVGRMLWPALPRWDLLEGILACLAEEDRRAEREVLLTDNGLLRRVLDRECKPIATHRDVDLYAMYCETAFRCGVPERAPALMRARAASCPPAEHFCLLDALVRGYADAKGLTLPPPMSALPASTSGTQPAPPPDWAHVAAFARECVESALRLELPLRACAGGLLRVAAVDGPLALALLRRLLFDRELPPPPEPSHRPRRLESPTFPGYTLHDTRRLLKWAAAVCREAGADGEWERLKERLALWFNSKELASVM